MTPPPSLNLAKTTVSDLENLSIKNISYKQSCGRKFEVSLNHSTCEVIFHDIYITAEKLTDGTRESFQLDKIKVFVKRLIKIEETAAIAYEERAKDDFCYATCTTLHRISHLLYGFGTHQDRLNNLMKTIESKIAEYTSHISQCESDCRTSKANPMQKFDYASYLLQRENQQEKRLALQLNKSGIADMIRQFNATDHWKQKGPDGPYHIL